MPLYNQPLLIWWLISLAGVGMIVFRSHGFLEKRLHCAHAVNLEIVA